MKMNKYFLFSLLFLVKLKKIPLQQTYVLMETSWRRLEDVFRLRLQKTSPRRLQDFLIKTNISIFVIRLQDVFKTFSRYLQDIFKTSCQDIFKMFSRRLQGVFKTSSRRLAKTFSRRLQNVFKASCKNVFKTSSRRLQDVFKTYHQVKLFLLTRFQDVFETYSKRF